MRDTRTSLVTYVDNRGTRCITVAGAHSAHSASTIDDPCREFRLVFDLTRLGFVLGVLCIIRRNECLLCRAAEVTCIA
jgi:hypothetical protein